MAPRPTSRRPRPVVAGFAVLLTCLGILLTSATPASAGTETVLTDGDSCHSLAASTTWDTRTEVCTINSDVTVASGDTLRVDRNTVLVIPSGVRLVVHGEFIGSGSLIQKGGAVENSGTFRQYGFWNAHSGASFVNVGVAEGGQVNSRSSAFFNGGMFTATGSYRVEETVNAGTFVNERSSLTVRTSDQFHNLANFENEHDLIIDGVFNNYGTLDSTHQFSDVIVMCTGSISGPGAVLGDVDEHNCFFGSGSWSDAANWKLGKVPGADELAWVMGEATTTADLVRTGNTVVRGRLTIAAGRSFSNSGNIFTVYTSNTPQVVVEGSMSNRGEVQLDGHVRVTGVLRNYAQFVVGSNNGVLENAGGVLNFHGASITGGIANEAGGTFRNFGLVRLRRSTNTNAGTFDNGVLAELRLENELVNAAGGVLWNDGEILLRDTLTFPPELVNTDGGVLVNDVDALIDADGDSTIVNQGNVENRGAIEAETFISNDGSWCGPGTTDPAVVGTQPLGSCKPHLDLGPARTTREGDNFSFTATFADHGAITDFTAWATWGDGTSSDLTVENLPGPRGVIDTTHIYVHDGQRTIELVVCDPDYGCTSDTVRVEVANVPPSLEIPFIQTREGSPTEIPFTASDPGADVLTVTEDDIDCGDGGILTPGSLAFDGTDGSFTCTFDDGRQYHTISVTVADDDTTTTARRSVLVENVAPTIDSVALTPAGAPVAVDEHVAVSVAVTDPGADDIEATIHWGDGTTTVATTAGRVVEATHTYTAAGFYDISVRVTDDDGASDRLVLDEPVVVYDPDGPGLQGNASLEAADDDAARPGRAPDSGSRLSVSARYREGDTQPSGRLGIGTGRDLQLEATGFDWLVVTDTTAYLQGTGTWADGRTVRFLLTVEPSAGGDRYRLQVWAGDVVVHDTQPGDDRLASPTTTITSGSLGLS